MKRTILFFLCLFAFPAILFLNASQESTPAETFYYALEMNDVLVGYSETTIHPGTGPGDPRLEKTRLHMKLKALGTDFDVKLLVTKKADPDSGKTLFLDADIIRGDQELGWTFVFEGNEVCITPKPTGLPKTVTLDDDVIIDDSSSFPYLIRDFGEGKIESKTYEVLNFVKAEVGEKKFTLKGRETLTLCGRDFECLVFEAIDFSVGVTAKHWIDAATARVIRTEASSGVIVYAAESTVKMMIVRGDLDDTILADVKASIADFEAISYMKVKAKIRTAGEWVTAESLNVPGQRFEGTVKNNVIDGVFEIEHRRYDGRGAPPFPTEFGGDEALKKCLEPQEGVESDDAVLIAKAKEITAGSKDCWEAACRLSKWVAEEIAYEIPGGSARFTYDNGKGECGSHSRLLAAFCRGVGIPARFVTGCMYTPLRGGCFGQHVWNEIYMGDAGWITVDSTAREIDFVDSGHIRLGLETSFNPEEMEVLDFRAGALSMGQKTAGLEGLGKVPWEVGKTYNFTYAHNGKPIGTETLTVKSFDQTISGGVYTVANVTTIQTFKASFEWKLKLDGTPIAYKTEGKGGSLDYTIECAFSEGEVVEKVVKAGQPIEKTIPLTDKTYLIDNNNGSILAFLALTAPEKEGGTFAFKAFHPPSMTIIPAQVTVKGLETITSRGREVECRHLVYSVAGTKIEMWIDGEGRLLREAEAGGAMVLELMGE
jgi:hypothetical protein